ncbi:MAG: SAM-dependent methyltransferase [Deltaproteobacteria bacterium]|nr:SAM-dependent methyltransferase [Deltaproteobacteria bacterium]
MHDDSASRTAEYMALFRALESCRRPAAARLFTDPYAARLLGWPLSAAAHLAALPLLGGAVVRLVDRRAPGARSSAVARTRLIDDAVQAALRDGIRQLVVLGAGFDCRAHRLPLGGARVFEIDHPATLAAKRARLAALGAGGAVTYVAADFNRSTIAEVLSAAGIDRQVPAVFLWEGVTNYLSAAAVDATLRAIAAMAPGSRLLFTYVDRAALDGSDYADAADRRSMVAAWGEPWTFGLEPAEVKDYLAARGLRLLDDQGACEYRARYWGAAGPHQDGYAFYHVAQAAVGDTD